MESFIKNRPFSTHDHRSTRGLIEQRIWNIINNVGRYGEARNLVDNLSPVARTLGRLQSDHTTIADACDAWFRLLAKECFQQYKDKV